MLTESEVEALFLRKAREYGEDKNRYMEMHLTDLVSTCWRKVYFEKHLPLPEDPESMLRLWRGKIVHSMPLTSNHELKLEYNGVKTSIDEYENGILIEKKTADFIPNTVNEIIKYFNHYLEQITLEAFFLIMNNYEVKKCFLLFIKDGPQDEKGRKPLKAFDVTEICLDLQKAERLFNERIEILRKIMTSNEPPEIPGHFSAFDYPCSYCKYRWRCW